MFNKPNEPDQAINLDVWVKAAIAIVLLSIVVTVVSLILAVISVESKRAEAFRKTLANIEILDHVICDSIIEAENFIRKWSVDPVPVQLIWKIVHLEKIRPGVRDGG